MKVPRFIKIQFPENRSFDVVKVVRPYFVVPWHFHPELEIMLVTQGQGTRFVGDSVERFEATDLVMLGPNLAHVWKSDDTHFKGNQFSLAEAIYIVFTHDSFGKEFFSVPEMDKVRSLLMRSQKGIKFGAATKKLMVSKFQEALTLKGTEQFFLFMDILQILSESMDFSYLCSEHYKQKLDASDLHRLDSVLDYLLINFKNDIKLEDVASVANMSVNAFCRYFKDRTNKTAIQFLNEIRIEHAHKMLTETQLNVDQISVDSGFKNVSNFYQQFQKVTGVSPLKFRKEHKDKFF
jgi:AraC-like DNA-binding protein